MVKEKKIDKIKQKKQNEIMKDAVDDFDRFENFISTNLKKIMVTFVAIAILIAVGAVGYTKFTEAKQKISSELIAAKTVEELNSVIKKYSDNLSVFPARLKLGTIYFNDGKFQDALNVYTQLASDAPTGEVKNRAKLNEAYTMEALNKTEEAADKFASIGVDPKLPGYIRNEANFSAGRIYNAENKIDKAKICLKAIDFKKPGFFSSQGKKLLQRLN